jgi:hypothetical protein
VLPAGHERCRLPATDQDADGVDSSTTVTRQAVVNTQVWAEAGNARWPLGVQAIGQPERGPRAPQAGQDLHQ